MNKFLLFLAVQIGALILAATSFAAMRLTLLDVNGQPVVGAAVMAMVDGTKFSVDGDDTGFPSIGNKTAELAAGNYITNSNGQILSQPQKDFPEARGGLFSLKKAERVTFGMGLYSKGLSSSSYDYYNLGAGFAFKCAAVSGNGQVTQEDLKYGTVRIPFNDSGSVDVVCKATTMSSSDILARLKEAKELAEQNGHAIPAKGA